MSKQSLVKGATILAVAGIVVKIFGAVFRLPLVNWIGDTGMADYSPAYYIYAFLMILATSGLPVAISKMVSESIAIGNHYQAHRVFTLASRLMFVMGFVFFLILFIFAPQIAALMKNPDAAPGMRMIAPSLLLVPVMAAVRGYFQGMQNMKPTAISQTVEQFFRVVVGLTASYILFFVVGDGVFGGYDKYAGGAAGANLGATAGSLGGFLMIIFIYMLARKGILKRAEKSASMKQESDKSILKKILIISVPITIGAAILPIANLVDSALVVNRLLAGGFATETAKSLYGQLSGFIGPLINVPQLLTQAVAVSIVPIIAAAFQLKNREELQKNTALGIRMSVIIGYPCAFGLMVLAEPILLLLYPNQAESASSAAPLLVINAFGLLFLSITQTVTGILQGVGKQTLPVRNLCIGIVAKIIVTWILVGIPAINVKGAAIGTVLMYMIAVTLSFKQMLKYTNVHIDINLTFIRPLISAGVMGALVFGIYKLLMLVQSHNSIATLLSVLVGAVVYAIMIFVTKSVQKEELLILPKGDKLVRIANKFVK